MESIDLLVPATETHICRWVAAATKIHKTPDAGKEESAHGRYSRAY